LVIFGIIFCSELADTLEEFQTSNLISFYLSDCEQLGKKPALFANSHGCLSKDYSRDF
jgi:hypothetical protein